MRTVVPSEKLTPHEHRQLEAAEDRGYLLDTSRRRRLCLSSAWWEHCALQGIPYIRVTTRPRHQASLLVDLLPAGTQFSEEALKRIRQLFVRYQGRRGILFLGKNQVALGRIPVAGVEELVGMLQRQVRPLHNVYELKRRGGE